MPMSVDNFCRNLDDVRPVDAGVDELEPTRVNVERNVFLSRVATVQAENETLGKKEREKNLQNVIPKKDEIGEKTSCLDSYRKKIKWLLFRFSCKDCFKFANVRYFFWVLWISAFK